MKPLRAFLVALLLPGCTVAPIKRYDYRAYYATYRAAEQSGTCHIHQVAMTKKIVPIHYGFPGDAEADPSQDMRLRRFPFTGRSPLGGCVIEPNASKTVEVSVCPECVAAEQRWMKAHPQNLRGEKEIDLGNR